jgi:hypothetical protein
VHSNTSVHETGSMLASMALAGRIQFPPLCIVLAEVAIQGMDLETGGKPIITLSAFFPVYSFRSLEIRRRKSIKTVPARA